MDAQLVALAETLNAARKQANEVYKAHRSYTGIYGPTAEALEATLMLLAGEAAPRAYELLLTGHTVVEALEAVRA